MNDATTEETQIADNPRTRVRINTEIEGEPAKILLELKQRGLVSDNTDAVNQGLLVLYDRTLRRDLARLQLRQLKEVQ
ncbi:hypothetical protein Ngar_c24180 [Candidatus Nitrososphaera gargensis Ga9.2]|uniref:Uncharacterized protein n=1 Tax=Nitrososphaera gargensis (strain Ga9.2) TaxID=1237085 RepID=K0IL60_NITGG|nr:hypothetical protein [Candidatus Nitrososphaera gargensis]AFU59342.1 hypothetical protein Ngar_c24180 [Candidatus Nitrososphaera gargensis Ga9.2]